MHAIRRERVKVKMDESELNAIAQRIQMLRQAHPSMSDRAIHTALDAARVQTGRSSIEMADWRKALRIANQG